MYQEEGLMEASERVMTAGGDAEEERFSGLMALLRDVVRREGAAAARRVC